MLRTTLLALAVAGCAVLPLNAEEIRSIAVSGEGTVSAAPDIAEVIAGVQSRDATAQGALARNNAAMAKVMAAIRAAGVAEKDIETQQLTLSPFFDRNDRTGERRPQGYLAVNRVTVRLRKIPSVGPLLDTVVAAGANDLGGVRFTIDRPEPLLDEARRKAVADAQRRAKLLADAAGVTLGRVLRIDETGIHPPRPMFMQADMAVRAASAPVAPGEQEIRAVLNVRFAIQ